METKFYQTCEGIITVTKEKLNDEFKKYHPNAEYEFYVDVYNKSDEIFYSEEEVDKFLKEMCAIYIGEE